MHQLAEAPVTQEAIPTIPGTPFAGGFYAGQIRIGTNTFALVSAPKVGGEIGNTEWHENYDSVDGAMSYSDGLANTNAMAEAGSDLAKWAQSLTIGGHSDWYIPAQDELEIIYRNLKPTSQENYQWARSGINISAVVDNHPYTRHSPTQTSATAFQAGNAEAFSDAWYWTSTQGASDSDSAWLQDFSDGGQDYNRKSYEYRARAVRRVLVIE